MMNDQNNLEHENKEHIPNKQKALQDALGVESKESPKKAKKKAKDGAQCVSQRVIWPDVEVKERG